ncbi:MAG: hypothetical protein WCK60_02340 [Candidatus Nomurabacteria bacterium]
MKTTIALLSVLLIGVSVGFYLDHSSLIKKNDAAALDLAKIQTTSTKQTATIKTLLSCSNITEKTYQQTKRYTSVVSCIKTRLSVQ